MSTDQHSPCHWLQLWFSRVGAASLAIEDRVQEWLSPAEQERLRRIRQAGKRREYLLSRALMRHALSRQFSRAECGWQFSQQSASPPRVADLPVDTFLSLSHSGGYVCFAIANCAVGVDIELIRQGRDLPATARWFMDDYELAQLAGHEAAGADYFYRLWCAKEACFKALTPALQAQTSMRDLSHADLLVNRDDRRLIEGDGGEFRMAAVVASGPLQIEQRSFPQAVPVTLPATA